MKFNLLFLAVLVSFKAMAVEVSNEEKQARVAQIQKMGAISELSVEEYLRDLKYEEEGLSAEDRTQREMNILFDKIKHQVALTYQEKIEINDDADAVFQEVKEQIEADSELADPAYKEEVKRVALDALDAIQNGGITSGPTSSSLESVIQKNVEERSQYLNNPAEGLNAAASSQYNNPYPSTSRAKDAEKLTYENKTEILTSLTSGGENTKWVSTSSANYDLGKEWSAETSVNIQLKCKFLGTSISAGPVITFSRKFGTNAMLMFEGMEYPINPDGTFNRWKKDGMGRILTKGSEKQRRFMAFYCSVWQQAESTYRGEASVSVDSGVASITGTTALRKYEQTSSSLTSRRIYVPDSIGDQIVTVNMIRQICWTDFLKANIRPGLTVRTSINTMMFNTLANLVFTHPKSKCATDAHCLKWARNLNLVTSTKANVYPRCVEEPKEKYRYCVLRSLENSYCDLYQNGKKITVDTAFPSNECDNGTKCTVKSDVLYVPGTPMIFRAATATCQPINPRSYRRPVL